MHIRLGLAAIVGVFLGACAASPHNPPPAAGAAPTVVAVSYDPRVAAAQKRAREMGYHLEVRHGEQYFCRTVAPLGSRLTQKECLSIDTMAVSASMADENIAAGQQSHMCQGAGCVIY